MHVLAALLTGLLVGRPRGNASPPRLSPPPEPVPAETPSAALTGSVQAAVRSLLGIGGFVVFFSALSSVLDHLGVLQACAAGLGVVTGWGDHWCRTLLTGFLELSSSIGLMQGLSLSPPALVLAAFLLGWGGLCVHFQAAAVLSGSGLKMKERLGGKLLHGVLSALLAMALGPIFF